MLRISTIDSDDGSAVLRLEGQIAGPWVGELEAACGSASSEGRVVEIDLGDVTLVDRAGFELLDRLAGRSVVFRRCSPFQEEQLRQIAQLNRTRP